MSERYKVVERSRSAHCCFAEIESQEPFYFWREIGESDWMECGKDWYWKCVDSPEHDTRLLYAKPVSADKPRITEQDVREIIDALVGHIERNTCLHEETHRGGTIWEICNSCGAKWADDRGGKPEFRWPSYIDDARTLLNKLNAEQPPEATVPEIIEAVANFVGSQEGGPFTPAVIAAAIMGQLRYGSAFTKLSASTTPSHSQMLDTEENTHERIADPLYKRKD